MILIHVRVFFRWVDGCVRLVVGDDEEVGFVLVWSVFDPGDGFGYDGVTVPLVDFSDGGSVSYEFLGAFWAVECVDFCGEPVVESVVGWCGLVFEFTEVPFTDEAGVVAFSFEE